MVRLKEKTSQHSGFYSNSSSSDQLHLRNKRTNYVISVSLPNNSRPDARRTQCLDGCLHVRHNGNTYSNVSSVLTFSNTYVDSVNSRLKYAGEPLSIWLLRWVFDSSGSGFLSGLGSMCVKHNVLGRHIADLVSAPF